MKAVLMSIRAEICKTIFHRWTKRLEYRTRFNKDFKGKIFVYESGADGSHKVIGAFDAGYIVRDSADEGISEQDEKFLETLDKKTLEQYEKIVADKDVLYAIEIKNVRRYREPLTLREFCISNANQTVTRPPQSWQYIDIITNDLEPAFEFVNLEEVVTIVEDEGEQQQGEYNEPTPKDSSSHIAPH